MVYVDSAPFIYLIEKNEQYENSLDRFFTAMDQGEFCLTACPRVKSASRS